MTYHIVKPNEITSLGLMLFSKSQFVEQKLFVLFLFMFSMKRETHISVNQTDLRWLRKWLYLNGAKPLPEPITKLSNRPVGKQSEKFESIFYTVNLRKWI